MSITFNNTPYAAGFVGEDDGAAGMGFALDNVSTNTITITGTVTKVGDSVVAVGMLPGGGDTGITSTTNTLYVTQFDNAGMIQFSTDNPPTGNSFRFVLSNTALMANKRVTFDNDPTLSEYQVTCFVSGTLIGTARGDVAVEALEVGDLAVTASGALRPIVWVGHRTIDCTRHPRLAEVLPVRIAAHAFSDNRPARDLWVSPGHSLAIDLVGEVLIPASSLINGSTIRQERVKSVTYWHVELESHDLLMAENLATESYLEMGNRGFFDEAGGAIVLRAVPDAKAPTRSHAEFCRPFHAVGAVVSCVRERLLARALNQGWTLAESPLAGLHLIVDGRRMEPEVLDLSASFTIPASAETVWLVSATVVPAEVDRGTDLRELGVCVGQIVVDDGILRQVIAADDQRLCVGFHESESGPRRWTVGRARLPSELWKTSRDTFCLRVDMALPALPRWVEPTLEVSAHARRASAS